MSEKPFYCIIHPDQPEAYGETANLYPEFNIGLGVIGYGYSKEQAYDHALERLCERINAMRPIKPKRRGV
jgi:hypothetical protein